MGHKIPGDQARQPNKMKNRRIVPERNPALARAGKLRSKRLLSEFIDIGVPEDYDRYLRSCPLSPSGAGIRPVYVSTPWDEASRTLARCGLTAGSY